MRRLASAETHAGRVRYVFPRDSEWAIADALPRSPMDELSGPSRRSSMQSPAQRSFYPTWAVGKSWCTTRAAASSCWTYARARMSDRAIVGTEPILESANRHESNARKVQAPNQRRAFLGRNGLSKSRSGA